MNGESCLFCIRWCTKWTSLASLEFIFEETIFAFSSATSAPCFIEDIFAFLMLDVLPSETCHIEIFSIERWIVFVHPTMQSVILPHFMKMNYEETTTAPSISAVRFTKDIFRLIATGRKRGKAVPKTPWASIAFCALCSYIRDKHCAYVCFNLVWLKIDVQQCNT